MTTSYDTIMIRLIKAFSICLLLTCNVVLAQEKLPVDEIEVIKHFDARLADAQKLSFLPRLPQPDTTLRQYTNYVTIVPPQITYEASQLRPLALRPEEQPKTYRGNLRAGYGAPHALLGDLSYHLIDKAPGQLYFSANHYSANEQKTPLKKLNNTGGTLQGGYAFAPELSLKGSVSYDYDRFYFYGVDPADNVSYVDASRKFKTFELRSQLENTDPISEDIYYGATFDFYNLQDDLGTKESGTTMGVSGRKIFDGQHVLSLSLGADFASLKDTEEKRTLVNFHVLPAFAYHAEVFAIKAGFRFEAQDGDFYGFPDVSVFVRIAGNALGAFARADGGLTMNTYHTLSTANPYVDERLDRGLVNTIHRDYTAGVKGNIRKLDYMFSAGMTTVDNLQLFEQDFFDYRKYQPLYDDGKFYRVEGSVTTPLTTSVKAGGSFAKIFYDLDNQEKAWYRPGFEGTLFASLMAVQKKLSVTGRFIVRSGAPYRTEFGENDKLKGMLDLSVSADYYFIENVGAFVQLNNLLGRKYEPWNRYAGFGVNGVAGVLVRI